jgi:trans-aconitate methyltransferase
VTGDGRLQSPEQVSRYFESWDLRPAVAEYLGFHRRRYAILVRTAVEARARLGAGPISALDVGTFLQTQLLREALPQATVHTLSEPTAGEVGWGAARPEERHTRFDLNDAQWPERWPEVGPVDLIVMAEVIEHLHTAPSLVLACVASWLRPGGRLILQTPNAARLQTRARLLAGRHPYEMIREDATQAGHFREYTLGEIRSLAAGAGLAVESLEVFNYFTYPSRRRETVNRLSSVLPSTLREGITAVLAKPSRGRVESA